MPDERKIDSLNGKTIRWTFTDGPVAGTTFEHTFCEDGTVVWRGIEGSAKGRSVRSATVKVADEIFAVSYLAATGHTLTVVLNFQRKQMVGFASNSKEWYQQEGTFEVVSDSA